MTFGGRNGKVGTQPGPGQAFGVGLIRLHAARTVACDTPISDRPFRIV